MCSLHMFLTEKFLLIQTVSPLSLQTSRRHWSHAWNSVWASQNKKNNNESCRLTSQTVIVHEGRQMPPTSGLEGPMRCVSRLRPLPIITLISSFWTDPSSSVNHWSPHARKTLLTSISSSINDASVTCWACDDLLIPHKLSLLPWCRPGSSSDEELWFLVLQQYLVSQQSWWLDTSPPPPHEGRFSGFSSVNTEQHVFTPSFCCWGGVLVMNVMWMLPLLLAAGGQLLQAVHCVYLTWKGCSNKTK